MGRGEGGSQDRRLVAFKQDRSSTLKTMKARCYGLNRVTQNSRVEVLTPGTS